MFGKKKKAPSTEYHQLRNLKKVAIVGFAEHKRLAPFDDSEFEIWGLNELYDHIPLEKAKKERRLRWFEIHKREAVYDGNPFGSRNNETKHVEKLNGLGQHCPVYMGQHWDDIATSIPYPLQTMIDNYGGYFTNSISYMIALAVYEGFEEIHIYGVDMAQATEWANQRPSCEYFVGLAKGKGIRVYMPPDADLCKTSFLYGFEEDEASALKAKLKSRQAELQKRLNENNHQLQMGKSMSDQIAGALQDLEYILQSWV